ncbi:MAG: hypothetical protein DRP09_15295 [Candidatus Thorarchaeota archaeon]|nr:MAG: hypothetical protein DRP09_15295 [Candidatus Thorarchaeota archaeon]
MDAIEKDGLNNPDKYKYDYTTTEVTWDMNHRFMVLMKKTWVDLLHSRRVVNALKRYVSIHKK